MQASYVAQFRKYKFLILYKDIYFRLIAKNIISLI